jgi:hypothetical protein
MCIPKEDALGSFLWGKLSTALGAGPEPPDSWCIGDA